MASLHRIKSHNHKHAIAVLNLLLQRLRLAWPEVKVTIRADSGFCRWRLIRDIATADKRPKTRYPAFLEQEPLVVTPMRQRK
ncbi:hypothetical protein [Singulisphaera sp. Ch08]|uniref:hypothetical protein n=1 Tax=Singulisphaera sp. Ch08 TaxID=3120278 RepID=UPI0038732CC0